MSNIVDCHDKESVHNDDNDERSIITSDCHGEQNTNDDNIDGNDSAICISDNEKRTSGSDQDRSIAIPTTDTPLCMEIPQTDNAESSEKSLSTTSDVSSANIEDDVKDAVNHDSVNDQSDITRPPKKLFCPMSQDEMKKYSAHVKSLSFTLNSRVKMKSGSVLCPPRLQAFPDKSKYTESPLNGTEKTTVDLKTSFENPQKEISTANNEDSSSLCFVPLKTLPTPSSTSTVINTSSATSLTASMSSDFVFGQNIHERILKEESSSVVNCSVSNEVSTATPNLSAIKKEKSKSDEDSNSSSPSDKKSLSESAKEYESRLLKRKFEEVPLVTGEENEMNVLQINCKLFTFDNGTSNWLEKGRGILRVNKSMVMSQAGKSTDEDEEEEEEEDADYRLIMRLSGSYRVVLNAKVWNGMVVERANKKSLRFTAPSNDNAIKIQLIVGSPNDIDTLQNVINSCIQKKKKFCIENAANN